VKSILSAPLHFAHFTKKIALMHVQVCNVNGEFDFSDVYRVWKLEGTFIQDLDWTRYPLDEHDLTIDFEDSVYPNDILVYMPDELDSAFDLATETSDGITTDRIDLNLFLPGWVSHALAARVCASCASCACVRVVRVCTHMC
jgi:hypothetical protein